VAVMFYDPKKAKGGWPVSDPKMKLLMVKCAGRCGKSKEFSVRESSKAVTWMCAVCLKKQPKTEQVRGKLFQEQD